MKPHLSRNNIIIKNSIINYCIRGGVYLFTFLSVPFALQYMGKERFGIFETMVTFISWAYLANLGIGNGLRNSISKFLAIKQYQDIKGVIGTAFFTSFLISVFLFITGNSLLYFVIDYSWIFSNISVPLSEIKVSFVISFSFFCINLFLGLFSSISFGVHKSYLATAVQLINFALYSLLLFLLIKFEVTSALFGASIIFGISMTIGQLFPVIWIIKQKSIWPPTFKEYKKYYKNLLTTSFSFFFLQITTVFLFSSDNFILSKLLSPNEVTEYVIINKVFFVIINLYSIVLIQVWNSTTEALANNEIEWIKQIIKKLHILLIPVVIGAFIIAFFFNDITILWLKQNYNYPLLFRLLFVLYITIHCSNAIYVNILNGIGRLKFQTLAYLIAAFINIAISYYFIKHKGLGIESVLYSKIICISFTSLICMLDTKFFFKSKNNERKNNSH